jgi:EAL domain-containing protein (putative c-di-GMP-specific phosphodiesterase class I)
MMNLEWATLDYLRRHDCGLAQRYYVSRPKTVADISAILRSEQEGRRDIMQGDF